MIRFLLDDELIELADVPADLTVLDWLRTYRQRNGTKEGCGSGDCGACTVVVAAANEIEAGAEQTPVSGAASSMSPLKYESINSCITFIGALHGKQLLTVESLADGDTLHPVQQAMVDEHGSQCGFCTPGFVMSLYALYQSDEKASVLNTRIEQALGGNLCRCTGYRPIKQAAVNALAIRDQSNSRNAGGVEAELTPGREGNEKTHEQTQEHADSRFAAEQSTAKQLLKLAQTPPGHTGFHQPDTLKELVSLYAAHPQARLLGGGTDLALEVTQHMKDLPLIISVNAVPELRVIEITDTELLLGAAVNLSDCLSIMKGRIPHAEELLLRFGSDQVRNQATIGGNIGSASPIGDLPPLLIALNAVLILQSGQVVRELALEDHFLDYRKTTLQAGEFIRAVRIPLPRADSFFAVYKVSKRKDDDISSVCAAIHLPVDNGVISDARLAFGGMAAIPVRVTLAESAFNGQELSQSVVTAAQQALEQELQPISDARASAGYRMQVARNLLQRVLMESTVT